MKFIIFTKFYVNRINCVESRRVGGGGGDPIHPPLKCSCNYFFFEPARVKPGFHIIVSNASIVSVTEYLVTQSGRKDRTQFYWGNRFASDVRIV